MYIREVTATNFGPFENQATCIVAQMNWYPIMRSIELFSASLKFPPWLFCSCLLLGAHCAANAQSDVPLSPEASKQRQAAKEVMGELLAVRSKISSATAALNQLEITGPQTNDISEKLAELKLTGPEKIKSYRASLKESIEKKSSQIKANHTKLTDQLALEKSQLDSAWTRDYPKKKKYFKSLLEQGALTKPLEMELEQAKKDELAIEQKKIIEMDEIRSGQFCSGCMKTRSEFLANGETIFPHPGQSIVPGTPQQLEDREKKFDNKLFEARQAISAIESNIQQATKKYENEVESSRKELADMELAYESKSAKSEADKLNADQELTKKSASLAEEEKARKADIAAKETELSNNIKALEDEISSRQKAFDEKRNGLTAALTTLKSQEAALSAKVNAAVSKYVAAQREFRSKSYRSTGMQEINRQHDFQQVRTSWAASEYDATVAQERYARSSIDDSPAAYKPEAIAAKQDKAQLDQQAFQKINSERVESQESESVQPPSRLTERADLFRRSLQGDVQEKIQRNIDTFSSPVNVVRAVINNSIDSFKSGAINALINKALGNESCLSCELTSLMDKAKPSIMGTLKSEIMPTIEDVAIESVVSARCIQDQRECSVQERTVDRGFARFEFSGFGANLKKHFNGLLRTAGETYDNATVLLGSPE